MKNDEFAFFNQQLAAMLRDGIPLEGALQKLCAEMQHDSLRNELQLLAADLARGIPLRDAVTRRQLPELYQCLLTVGAQSNDLPGVLTLLADHYQRRYTIWTKLKGLLVYPVIVLLASLLLSVLLAYILDRLVWPSMSLITQQLPPAVHLGLWLPPILLGTLLGLAIVALSIPAARQFLRWRVPSFRESNLAQVASALALLIRNGVPLDHALALLERMESGSRAGEEISAWRRRLAAGHAKFSEVAEPGRAFPPLFIWLVSHGREDLAAGFQRAADIYQSRATHRADMLLYSALPCSVLALGLLIIMQVQPIFHSLTQMMNCLGGE
jgi:type II secretory pathway component PulF